MARILAIGGAHIDRTGRLSSPHRPGASNPGHWESTPGGGVFNAARNLARLGHRVALVSPRGGDAAAGQVAAAAREAGIEDCPLTFLDRATPSYTSILEPDGNLVTALADMALYDRASRPAADERPPARTAGRRRSPHRRFQPSRKRACRTRRSRRRHRGAAGGHRRLAGQGGPLARKSVGDFLSCHERRRGRGPDRDPHWQTAPHTDWIAAALKADRPDQRPRQHGRRTGHRL
jgi:hypothetical protein